MILLSRLRGRTCGILETPVALEGESRTYMPPATRLTIRDPGIFTSIGYGTPCLRPCRECPTPSLPFARWLQSKGNCVTTWMRRYKPDVTDPQTKTLGYLRPLYRVFHPDWRAVSWLVKLKSAWHLLLQNISSAQSAAKSLLVDPRLKTSRTSAKGSRLSRRTSTGKSAICIVDDVEIDYCAPHHLLRHPGNSVNVK
jgi:hypothetical protein